jgi:hypothetical protein
MIGFTSVANLSFNSGQAGTIAGVVIADFSSKFLATTF